MSTPTSTPPARRWVRHVDDYGDVEYTFSHLPLTTYARGPHYPAPTVVDTPPLDWLNAEIERSTAAIEASLAYHQSLLAAKWALDGIPYPKGTSPS